MNELMGDLFSIGAALSWAFAVIFFRYSGVYFKTIPLKLIQNSAALVFFVSSVFLFGEPWFPELSSSDWLLVILSAILGITLGDTLYIAALNRIGAGSQAILDCLYSPFLIWMAYLFFSETLTVLEWTGAALVISSILVVSANKSPGTQGVSTKDWAVGFVYGALSQLVMAACVLIVRPVMSDHSILTITTYRFFFGNGLLLVYTVIAHRDLLRIKKIQWEPLLKWVLPGTFLGPFLSTICWFAGFKYTLAGRAAIYNQLSTLFILILAAIFLNEPLTPKKILAILLATTGGLLVSWA